MRFSHCIVLLVLFITTNLYTMNENASEHVAIEVAPPDFPPPYTPQVVRIQAQPKNRWLLKTCGLIGLIMGAGGGFTDVANLVNTYHRTDEFINSSIALATRMILIMALLGFMCGS